MTTAAPFAVLLVLMCVALVKGLREELADTSPRRRLRDIDSPSSAVLADAERRRRG